MPVNPIADQIRLYARHLRIPTFAEYQDILRRMKPDDTFDELLLECMKAESIQRQENQNRRRLKAAAFPYHKVLDDLDVTRYAGSISALFLNELASCQFITDKKNIVMIGNPGRGKTHLAIALGLKACALGFDVLFKNAAALSTELMEAKDNYTLGRLEKRIQKAELLIIDELSYISFNRHQSELLFKVISERTERGSVIVTTNLSFSQWTELFENTAMVAALVDRLTFQSYILDMNGESYRLEQSLKNRK
ncbi:MAG: ATP-binding protein [Tissierellia bacterium]|jgi:DNA replication protein DnaC|nr:ATP-binding protein [Tissierellia bacterium]